MTFFFGLRSFQICFNLSISCFLRSSLGTVHRAWIASTNSSLRFGVVYFETIATVVTDVLRMLAF